MYKWMEFVAWVFIILAVVGMLFGVIGFFKGSPFIFTTRGCTTLSIAFLMFSLNFTVIRAVKLNERNS